MKMRPTLRHGDIVKLHKRYRSHPFYSVSKDSNKLNDTFVVLRANGRSNKYNNKTSDGNCRIKVLNLRTKETDIFSRKQLWKTGANWKDYYFPGGQKAAIF